MHNFVKTFLNFSEIKWNEIGYSTYQTLYMELVSMIFTIIFGFLLGLLLFILSRRTSRLAKIFYTIISIISNIFRSIPFIILVVLLVPLMSAVFGSFIGEKPAVLPLTIAAAPLFARMVESSFREVDSGVLEAADAMGATPMQKIFKVLVPESMPSLISGVTITTISMIGYTAMASVIGSGGLGATATQEGYTRGNYTLVAVATVIILIIVLVIQFIGDRLVDRVDKRKK